jgi:hypothetical protein
VLRRFWLSLQFLQQRLGLPQIGSVDALGEPAIQRCEELPRLIPCRSRRPRHVRPVSAGAAVTAQAPAGYAVPHQTSPPICIGPKSNGCASLAVVGLCQAGNPGQPRINTILDGFWLVLDVRLRGSLGGGHRGGAAHSPEARRLALMTLMALWSTPVLNPTPTPSGKCSAYCGSMPLRLAPKIKRAPRG